MTRMTNRSRTMNPQTQPTAMTTSRDRSSCTVGDDNDKTTTIINTIDSVNHHRHISFLQKQKKVKLYILLLLIFFITIAVAVAVVVVVVLLLIIIIIISVIVIVIIIIIIIILI